jgi:hypothetical protein
MGPAYAQETSPGCAVYTITWVPGFLGGDPFWRAGFDVGCLGVPAGTTPGLPPEIDDFVVTYADEAYTVTYPDSCTLLPSGDPSPDDLIDGSAALSLLGAQFSCRYAGLPDQVDNGDGTFSVELGPKPIQTAADRIELVIKCCQSPG